MPRTTESYGNVTGFTNEFIETEVANTRNSALDMQQFVTVNTTLEANTGDKISIGLITASGEAEDVAEGKGNTKQVAVGVSEKEYEVKTAQAWFQYTDERLRRTPNEVAAGISHLGITLPNKFNTETYAEWAKSKNTITATVLDFDTIVDAQSQISLDTVTTIGQDEGAASTVEQSVANQTTLFIGKDLLKALRKNCKDELKYVEAYNRTGYVVTDFIKADVEIETSQKGSRSADDANKRINNIFARQTYVVALTDETKAVVGTIGAGA